MINRLAEARARSLAHSRIQMNNMNLIENLMAKRSFHSVDEIEMTKLNSMLHATRKSNRYAMTYTFDARWIQSRTYTKIHFFATRLLARSLARVCTVQRAHCARERFQSCACGKRFDAIVIIFGYLWRLWDGGLQVFNYLFSNDGEPMLAGAE